MPLLEYELVDCGGYQNVNVHCSLNIKLIFIFILNFRVDWAIANEEILKFIFQIFSSEIENNELMNRNVLQMFVLRELGEHKYMQQE